MRRWVVIAAFNEERQIYRVVTEVIERGFHVVVVDDCSRDGTHERALAAGAFVCRHTVNLGQGAALQTGIRFALERGADLVFTFDADGQHDPNELEAVAAPVISGDADVVLGSRFLNPEAAKRVPPIRRQVLKLAAMLTRLTGGLDLTDAHNGFRCFSRKAASALEIKQNRMAHASEIVSWLTTSGFRVKEGPVTITYTEYSLSKGQSLFNSFNILWESLMGRLTR
jgi:glycosyltransferase involved in cell wall biosynthesis